MLLSQEEWMDVRAFRSLRATGASWAEIARECGCDWRTVKKYLADGAPATPPAVTERQHPHKVIEPFTAIIDGWIAPAQLARGRSR